MNKIKIYKVSSILDMSTSTRELEKILALLEDNCHIGLDLTRCTYVSSAGLRVMLHVYKIASSQGGRVDLIGASNEIRKVMDLTGFSRFFKMYRTVGECMDA